MDISVIIACHNHGRFLRDAVESVLGQAVGTKVEVIVVDDGSTDETPEVAARFGDRIQYIAKKNAGLSAARNTGILASAGQFIQILDADDMLGSEMLRTMLCTAVVSTEYCVFHSSWDEIDVNGTPFATHEIADFPNDVFHFLLAHNVGPPCRYMLRRSAFANAGLFDVNLKSCEDWDMWLRLAASGCKFKAVPTARALYRRTPHSMSRHYERMWNNGLSVLKKNRHMHGRCGTCNDAFKTGKAHLRSCCFMGILKHDLVSSWRDHRVRDGMIRAMSALRVDPAIGFHLARETWRHMFRAGEPT